jgi:penicillin-binding protein 1A
VRKYLKVLMKVLFGGFALSILMGLVGFAVVIYISYDLPQLNSLSDYSPPIPSRIYSKDGHLLMELSREKRILAQIDDIPDRMINTFLAAEDDNFYNHSGVDYIGIARAMLINIKAGRIKQGASTITQQVAKSLLLSSERTFSRKIKDLILAKKIEEKLSKKEILFLYLNQVYLGGGYYGVKSAFRGYFDKELAEATIAETALVAGLLVAPGKYSPYVNPRKAKSRQRYVLGRLLKTEKINEVEYEAALNEDIKIQIRKPVPLKAGYFSDWIRQRLMKHFGKEEFLTNGYEVITTIDWELQDKAEKEVLAGVKRIDRRQGYKGPLRSLKSEEEKVSYVEAQRKAVYKQASNFLIFKSSGESEREFQYPENETQEILNIEKERISDYKIRGKRFLEIGNQPEAEENFSDFLNFDRPIEVLVTKVSNQQRMIYANYAGIKIMIPHEKFKWAHKREIKVERNYWAYVNNPESIVKPGDIILVKVSTKKHSVWKYIYKKFKKKYEKNTDLISALKEQEFYIGTLDQEAEVEGALLSISPINGEIIAMVGGANFAKSQFNRVVQSNRQPGSAFKPLIFAVGLENHYTPASILLDSPQALGGVDDTLSWKPRNYDGKFKGSMTLRRALETSRNIPTIKLTQEIGVKKITNFVNRLNLDVDLPQDLSVSLGSFGINLMNLVKMYSIFPNGGRKVKLKSIISIKDRFGNVHYLEEQKKPEENEEELATDNKDASSEVEAGLVVDSITSEVENKEPENPYLVNLNDEQIYDARLAYIMNNLLKGVIQRGTGGHTKGISPYIGGKTGTTNNYVDAWFVGFSSKVVTGVWTGFDNNRTLGWGETGSKSALPIWKEFMKLSLRKKGESDFHVPKGIVNVAVNVETGKLATDSESRFIEAFVEGTEPGNEKEDLFDETNDEDLSILDSEGYYDAQ